MEGDNKDSAGAAGTPNPDGSADPGKGKDAAGDPMMTRLVAAEREREAARKETEQLRAKVKQHEQAARKTKVLDTMYTEFPGLVVHDVRGAVLVAADDGLVDLYADDPKPTIDKLKELLAARAKAARPSPTTSIGGTPGVAGAPVRTGQSARLPI